jgi:hypothetical protein
VGIMLVSEVLWLAIVVSHEVSRNEISKRGPTLLRLILVFVVIGRVLSILN